ncbi:MULTISPECIES: helix-turn-helix domain-containing protein [Streptomyces]|uniref:Resolvase HTH domain-containing protein n=1 Tax=Streptomyces bangladeshensis TaxID=295352 RepID=A0ABN3BSK7_9ACTN|nr:helix-turn-helix domain-containing protein [Streptomyces sp. FBKL.4005]OYP14027.1 Hin recombinase [Streptomyces sp. FBKL.4005]
MATDQQRAWNSGGRTPPGHKPSKVTPAQRDEICRRLAANESPQALAAEYGVSVHTIYRYR